MKNVNIETCANCGRVIGKLETPMVWQENVVCPECFGRLSGMRTIPPIPDAVAPLREKPRRSENVVFFTVLFWVASIIIVAFLIWRIMVVVAFNNSYVP